MKRDRIQVAVLMGGPSSEHAVSLKTGKAVLEGMDKQKCEALPVHITKDLRWHLPGHNYDEMAALKKLRGLAHVAFLALHGEYGEDGTVQEALTLYGIPFTGSSAHASAFGMNKAASGIFFREHGLLVPQFITVSRFWAPRTIRAELASERMDFPLVVKPLNLGSSVGVHIVHDIPSLESLLKESFKKYHSLLLQEYIGGREMTCGVLEENNNPRALPVTEIIPQASGFFDYEAKYIPGASEEITPADISAELTHKIQAIALQTHTLLRCSGISRTDMILQPNGKIYTLEINTLPGLTETSLIPQQARAAGISFSHLIEMLIENSLGRKTS
jgi:D-alanine-D-alanine ligase